MYICKCCDEVYNAFDRKPLALPCGDVFCRNCLKELQTNNKVCIICKTTWAQHSVDSLIYIGQLVPSALEILAMEKKRRLYLL